MHQLPASDLRAVLAFGHDAVAMAHFGEVTPTLAALAGVVGADTATLTSLDLATQREVAVFWPSERARRLPLAAYAASGHAHPLRPALTRPAGRHQRPAVRISDVLSQRQWRSHPVRAVVPDLDDQVSVLLAQQHRVLHAVTLGRRQGTFSDRQRDLVDASGRFLASAVDRASRHGHRALQISPEPRWVDASSAPGLTDHGPARLGLSDRELEVLRAVAGGATDAQVARHLGLAPATVSKHLSRIYHRLQVPNRAAAVRRLAEAEIPGEPSGAEHRRLS